MAWTTRKTYRSALPSNWASIRKTVIARDKGKCVLCGSKGTEVDHIGANDVHAVINLRLLCKKCHAHKTAKQSWMSRKKNIGLKHKVVVKRPKRADRDNHPAY